MAFILTSQLVAAAKVKLAQDSAATGEPYVLMPDRDPAPVPPADLTIAPTVMPAGVAGANRQTAAARLRLLLTERGK